MAPGLKVLWATDGSESSLAAAPMIRSLLLPVADSVHVITVAPRPILTGARLDPIYLKPWSRKEREEAVEAALSVARDSAARLEAPDGVTVPQGRFGHPIQEILRAAGREKADLIVLGAKGQSALKLMLLGSIAQGVLQYSRRPVLLVRPGSTEVRAAVVGVDGSKASLQALRFLRGLALKPGALVVLARVVHLISQRPSRWSLDRGDYSLAANRLNEAAKKEAEQDLIEAQDVLAGSDITSVNEVLVGRPAEQLLTAAAQQNADLVVVGSRAPSRVLRYLGGSTAEMVAREALTSVLVVR